MKTQSMKCQSLFVAVDRINGFMMIMCDRKIITELIENSLLLYINYLLLYSNFLWENPNFSMPFIDLYVSKARLKCFIVSLVIVLYLIRLSLCPSVLRSRPYIFYPWKFFPPLYLHNTEGLYLQWKNNSVKKLFRFGWLLLRVILSRVSTQFVWKI